MAELQPTLATLLVTTEDTPTVVENAIFRGTTLDASSVMISSWSTPTITTKLRDSRVNFGIYTSNASGGILNLGSQDLISDIGFSRELLAVYFDLISPYGSIWRTPRTFSRECPKEFQTMLEELVPHLFDL